MKKRVELIFILAIISIVLAACGGKGNSVSSDKAELDKGEVEESIETRVIDTVMGEVVIPANPKRIVAAGYLGDLLALGVKPVGAPEFHMENPFLTELVGGIEDIGNEISLEKTLALEPDLIITSIDEDYDNFSKIAPTVVIHPDSMNTYADELRIIGDIVGKKQEAEEWITSFEEEAAEAREQLSHVIKADETVGIYILTDKDFYVLGDGLGRGGQAIYNALKLTPPPLVKSEIIDSGEAYKEVSLEVLPDYAADHIFLSVELEDENQETTDTLLNRELWKGLSAVKNDQVYQIPKDKFYHYDPLSIKGQMEIIVKMLLSRNK